MGGADKSNVAVVPRLSASNDPFEHEERFLLTRRQVALFASAISPRAAIETYDRARPVSYTRTTYFDTDDFAYFRSCDGPLARRLRIREYAMAASRDDEPTLSGIAFVELKQNAGTARSKVRLSAPPDLLRRLLEPKRPGDPADAELAALEPLSALATIEKEIRTPTMAPRLTTWYRRACLTAEDGRVRITLDEHLTFCRPQPIGVSGSHIRPTADEVIADGPTRILEIKLWGGRPDWLAEALEGISPAPNFSKFRMGMMAMAQKVGAPGFEPAAEAAPSPTLFALSGESAR
jgi:hypothetical protein